MARRLPEGPSRHELAPDLFPKRPPERSCGPCHGCCNVYYIEGVFPHSQRWEDCQHVDVWGGCGIYARRPEPCRTFRCMWLDGWGDDADRPDLLGVVLDFEPPRPRLEQDAYVTAIEVAPGRADEPPAQARLRELVGRITVKRVRHGAKGLDNFGETL